MRYETGTALTCRTTGEVFVVTGSTAFITRYRNASTAGECNTLEVDNEFRANRPPMDDDRPPVSGREVQEHSETVAAYRDVLHAWLTPEEFRGYIKGTAIAYLAKGGDLDIEKATRMLKGFIEQRERDGS